jgi:cell division protein FtsQ
MTEDASAPVAAPRRWTAWRIAVLGIAGVALVSSPVWGLALMRELTFFRVRQVAVVGVKYLDPAVVVARLRVDTFASLWDNADKWARRVQGHPQVAAVEIERRLPGTLIVHVTENVPVALVPHADGLRPVDAAGRRLPVDPASVPMDLPIVSLHDGAVWPMLDSLRRAQPALYAKLSDVRRDGSRELRFAVAGVPIRALTGIGARRIAEIVPVAEDLAHRRARVAELDLRFRDQVIARIQ